MPPKHLRYRWGTVWKTKWTCQQWNETPAKTWFTSWACHKYKLCTTCKSSNLYQGDTNWGDTNHPQKPTKPNLLTEVQEMKAELVAIRESIGNQHRTTTTDQYGFRNEERARPRGCADCLRVLREGFEDRSTHCFIGGRSGHFSYNCLASQAQNWAYFQGNGLRLHPEDRKQPWICWPNMCKVWENRRCYRSTPSLFPMLCQLVRFKIVATRTLGGA